MAKKKVNKVKLDKNNPKSRLSVVYLKQQYAPNTIESSGDNFISYGDTAPYRNLYPQFLIDLYNSSPVHRAITDSASSYIAGSGILIEDDTNVEMSSKLKSFLVNINSKETIEGLLSKVAKDLYLQGAFALNIIYSKDRSSIVSINHIAVEKVRIGLPNENGLVDTYYISSDWNNTRKRGNEPKPVPAFNPNDRSNPSQIMYIKDYTPGLDLYGAPSYSPSSNWALTDSLISEYHLSNIQHGFSGTTWINFNDGQPTEEEQRMVERAIDNKMSGPNGKKIVLTFTDEGKNTPDIETLSIPDAHSQYIALNDLIVSNLMIGHRVVSPALMGVKTEGQLGGRNELMEAYELYSRSVIQPYQDIIIKALSKLFAVNGIMLPIQIKDSTPFANKFGTDVLKEVLTQDELRKELGLEPLSNNEETIEEANTDLYKKKKEEYQELPLYDTKEEAEAEAERIGCSGYHTHSEAGVVKYMPCSSHDEIINLSKEDKLSVEAITELLMDLGENEEDLLIEYDLISEESLDDELEEDNIEAELNERLDLADVKTGKAYPNRTSKQDGTSKQSEEKGNIFRVRYIYTGNPAPERNFCKAMMKANKVYRKEDILAMSTRKVNPGWGPKGRNTYSIWLNDCSNSFNTSKLHKFYKGGGNCKHKWERRIYLQKGKRANNTDEVLSTTKARSRGFKTPVNPKQVPVAPTNLPNNGFLK